MNVDLSANALALWLLTKTRIGESCKTLVSISKKILNLCTYECAREYFLYKSLKGLTQVHQYFNGHTRASDNDSYKYAYLLG